MQEPYRYEVLPLDTADDDQRWAEYLDIFNLGFLDRRAAAANLETYRRQRREDQATLGMVTTEGPGLAHRQAVAAFACAPYTLNTGAGIHPCLVVNTIAVRPSHRRRGLLKEMMRRQLGAARDAGMSLAVLTASEATIYGRFGFGVANRTCKLEIDTRRFQIADGVAVADGPLEFVDPSFLEPHFNRIALAHQARYRGAAGRLSGHYLTGTGAWDRDDEGPSRGLRALVNFDASGTPNGFALFKHKGWDTEPITTEVHQVCSPDPAIDRALWRALASIDLVERLSWGPAPEGYSLALSLRDPWAIKKSGVEDDVWLRILDLPQATSQRGFEADGEVVLGISDAMGWCEGAWRITVVDGVGSAELCDAQADVTLRVDTLGRVWLGEWTIAELALAGLVEGAEDQVALASKLFATATPPVNLADF